jgi:uncharacterized membrane protein
MHPLYPALLPIPIICFAGALITDLAYIASAEMGAVSLMRTALHTMHVGL